MAPSIRSLVTLAFLAATGLGMAQLTPAAMATKLPDSLVFVTTTATTNSSLVWHPVKQRYYGLRPGLNTYPLETWLVTGGLSVAQTTCGFDTRGMWYNPATGNIERNGFSANGWATLDIDGASNAQSTFTLLFAGQNQPNIQSFGAFEPSTNSVLFYDSGTLKVYSRATAALTATIPLTGVSLVNVATYTVLYTGQAGHEILLYDTVLRRVLFFNRATGAFSGQCQLPATVATVLTGSSFRLSYTNGRFWIFNSTLRKWNAYCIWQQQCPGVLPVELLDFHGACVAGLPVLSWTTGSEQGSSHFTIERSADMERWEAMDRVTAAGHSSALIAYGWTDRAPLAAATVYYRLRQEDLDGTSELSPLVVVERCDTERILLQVFPDPTTGTVHVVVPQGVDDHVIALSDMQGRILFTSSFSRTDERYDLIDLGPLPAGTYTLLMCTRKGAVLGRARVVRE